MSLRRIHDSCTELLSLANDEWLILPENERQAVSARIDVLINDIRDDIFRHNAAVAQAARKHHPDTPRIPLSQLPPNERFAVTFHQVEMPGKEPYLPLDPDTEAVLAELPRRIALAHRAAAQILEEVEALMTEAEIVHVLNRSGAHLERIPAPASFRRALDLA